MRSFRAVAQRLVARHGAFFIGVGLLFTFCRWPLLTGWDESFYVAPLTSAIADRDLLLHNDLLLLRSSLDNKLRMLTTIGEDGSLPSNFGIGTAVVHASYSWPLLAAEGRPTLTILRAALALGCVALLALTVLVTMALCQRQGFTRPIARLASVLAIVFGPLALLGTRAQVDSHQLSALLAAALCLTLLAWLDDAQPRYALAAGLAAGLLAITRWQDGVFLVALAPAAMASFADRGQRRRRCLGAALASAAAAGAVAIQLAAWRVQFGHWLLVPQGGEYLHWDHPGILPLLLSTYHGLLPWTPGFALGLVALFWVRPTVPGLAHRLWLLGVFALVPVTIYVSACPTDWWGGEAYGPRRLCVLTPFVALGLAQALTSFQRYRARWALIALLALWSLFTVTAQLSRFDDLSVVFCSQTSSASPRAIASYSDARWIDRWPTWPHLLRPGFTFSDAPHNADRLLGLAAIGLLAVTVALAWSVLRRSIVAQRVVLGGALAWAVIALAWIAHLPLDRPWSMEWRQAVQGNGGCSDSVTSAAGFDDARHLICAARALRAGDEPAALHHLARVRGAVDYGIDRASLGSAVAHGSLAE